MAADGYLKLGEFVRGARAYDLRQTQVRGYVRRVFRDGTVLIEDRRGNPFTVLRSSVVAVNQR